MCADSLPVNQFMSVSDCSHRRHSCHPWPLIIWSGYFRKLLCTCSKRLIFPLTRHSWHAMNAAEEEVFSLTFTKQYGHSHSQECFWRDLCKNIPQKNVVSKPTTINYRRSIKLSGSDFFWSFIFTSSDQMVELEAPGSEGLGDWNYSGEER